MCKPLARSATLAHRLSWELFRGTIPTGAHVLHKCDTPACVNPDHLFLGTHSENMADMVRKGRSRGAVGVRNGSARLSEDDVREIRRVYALGGVSIRQIARRHGVSFGTIQELLAGKAWRHVA